MLVEALYNPAVAREAALQNLLREHGYSDLESVRQEGVVEGREEGREAGLAAVRSTLLQLVAQRGINLAPEQVAAIGAERDLTVLQRWLSHALSARSAEQLFV